MVGLQVPGGAGGDQTTAPAWPDTLLRRCITFRQAVNIAAGSSRPPSQGREPRADQHDSCISHGIVAKGRVA